MNYEEATSLKRQQVNGCATSHTFIYLTVEERLELETARTSIQRRASVKASAQLTLLCWRHSISSPPLQVQTFKPGAGVKPNASNCRALFCLSFLCCAKRINNSNEID